jgi:hypothetical protein
MTTLRGTPNQNIAATQYTAPVYEFRCLYSHDLRKKKKLWHDGSLRYHTFNKRVMVYDESKNYIGDSHWREAGDLQDGTELKLDKGVLVDVGERIGETQTDLAPLLEKRRPEKESSPQRPPLRPVSLAASSRSALGHSQARPKSLSDVLGLSQGPIGRARFPARSPYEQVHNPSRQPSHREEPPAKRPRTGLGKENAELGGDNLSGSAYLLKHSAAGPTACAMLTRNPSLQERRIAEPPKQTVVISLEDESIHLSPSRPTNVSKGRQADQETSSRGAKQQLSPAFLPKERSKTTASAKSKVIQPRPGASERRPVLSMTPSDNPSRRSSSSTGLSKNKLRLAAHKPRKKLIYKELLASSNRPNPQLQTETLPSASYKTLSRERHSSRTRKRNTRPAPNKIFSDLESDGEDGNMVVQKVGSPSKSNPEEQEMDRDLAGLFTQPSSPLFMPESQARVATEAPEPHSSDGSLSSLIAAFTTPPPNHPPAAPSLKMPNVNNASLPPPLSRPTILDTQLMVSSSKNATLHSRAEKPVSQSRSLRRVVSENDSPGYGRPAAAVTSAGQGRSTATSPDKLRIADQTPFENPAKPTKSFSDTVTRPTVHQSAKPILTEEDTAQESGPWSKVESYLLFDWFPPARERLVFEGQEQTPLETMVVKRGLLSDQVDAL